MSAWHFMRRQVDGGGAAISGYSQVATWADLPSATGSGEINVVQTTTGIPLVNRKPAGLWRDSAVGVWTYLGNGITAGDIVNVPSGTITATDTQSAVNELDTDLQTHIGSGGTHHAEVTTLVAGFMTAADKVKLNAITGANTGDQTITLSGDVSGTGTAGVTATLATVNASPQTDQFRKITVNGKGLVTASSAVAGSDINAAFGTQTNNLFYATPNGSAGAPTLRAIAVSDVPTLNQNTTGSAATLTTGRTLSASGDATGTSAAFNGSANASIPLTIANGVVTNAKLANVPTASFKGRVTAATGVPEDLTGTQATSLLDTATTSLKGLLSAADKTKLDGIAPGATANSSDATLLARANHTGTQAIATVAGLQTALDSKLDDSQATAFALTLLDDADAATARGTLGLAAIASTGSASDLSGNLAIARFNSGTGAGATSFWRGDGVWAVPAGGGGGGSVTPGRFLALAALGM